MHVEPKHTYFGALNFSRAATPVLSTIVTPAIESGSILRLRGSHIVGEDASIRLYRDLPGANGLAARQSLSTAGGDEKRLQCSQRDAEGERFAGSWSVARSGRVLSLDAGVVYDASEGADFTGCKTFPMPVGLPAGQWNVTVIQMAGNRGRARTEAAARRVDLTHHTLYDVESLARIYSVRPTSGSVAG